MIKENIKFVDEFTKRVYDIMKENKIENSVTLFPMLRKENDKLLLGTMIELNDKELFAKDKVVRPKYWIILDMNDYSLVELNKTEDKDYMKTSIIPLDKEYDDTFKREMKELEKFSIDKKIQYKNYLINDIKNDIMNTQNKILNKINNTIIVDNQKVNATDYIMANVEDQLEKETEKFVDFIVTSKYSTIIYYYQSLIEELIKEYKEANNINMDKMELAASILDAYYGEVYGVKYFFNI